MNPLEKAIAHIAQFWLKNRERSRAEGGGLFFWLFAYLCCGTMTVVMAQPIQRHHWFDFPSDLLIPFLISLFWVRTAWFRLYPIRMFGLSILLVAAGETCLT